MPTVYQEDGYRFSFYMNEGNEPAHIHVRKGGGQCKWWLDPLELAWSKGLKAQELRKVANIVLEIREFLLERWHEVHGNDE